MNCAQVFLLAENNCLVDVGGYGDVPEATNQRTRLEGIEIVAEICNDHFQDFIREVGQRRFMGSWLRLGIPEQAIDPGFALNPNRCHWRIWDIGSYDMDEHLLGTPAEKSYLALMARVSLSDL